MQSQRRAGTRNISDVKLDSFIPEYETCIRCHVPIEDHSTAHYGRIVTGWQTSQVRDAIFTLHNGEVHKIPTITERAFPATVRGLCCTACFTELYNTTWRDKNGHLRRAFDVLHPPVEQPANDDYDAAPITKGLYAPHVVKRGRMRDGFYEDPTLERGASSPVIDNPPAERKLAGFERRKRDDIQLKPKRVIVRNGKWKVNPTDYNYQPPAKPNAK